MVEKKKSKTTQRRVSVSKELAQNVASQPLKKQKKTSFFKDFKSFIEKGNAIDMAVGIIVGSVMTGVVNSLVKDIIMPPIGMLIGGVDFSNWFIVINKGLGEMVDTHYSTIAQAHAAGATTINVGLFFNALVSFFITMFAVFLIVRSVNKIRGQKPTTTRVCPYCKTSIDRTATKCPNCTANVKPLPPEPLEPGCESDDSKLKCKIKKLIK